MLASTFLAVICGTLITANAAVSVSPLFKNNMVLQRGETVQVSGKASGNKAITVTFNGQTKNTTSDADGDWKVILEPMVAKVTGGNLTAAEAGAKTVSLSNVVVGDVWICSGQSNMDMILANCDRQTEDVDTANYPALRMFRAPLSFSGEPLETVDGSWTVCSPSTAGTFSAVAFYFGREICDKLNSTVPIGLYLASVGGTTIDLWLPPEGLTDIPVLNPIFSQSILPGGPFSLFNGMVYPYSPLPAKGLIWYQGENAERTVQSADSYYLKMKALAQGYKRMLGMDEFPFYFVQLAYWGQQQTSPAPVLDAGGGWSADTRLQQANAMAIPHSGMASAMDVGSSLDGDQIWDGWHPKTKMDVGERLALWALKNDYGQSVGETSGPILRDVVVSGSTLVCSFDHVGSGLMVGSKTPYQPTDEVVGGSLDKFSIAGASGAWYDATATIVGDTVVLSSPSVSNPTKAAYACWQNPVGANLYNKDGLPASPFYMDDVNANFTITATTGAGGSISPAGISTFLKRHSALYTITPAAGQFIQEVTVDGVSVGAVEYYTFDPLYSNHTISATFGATAPSFTVAASSSGGGSISPSGAVSVAQGGSQTFEINAGPGVVTNLTVDGKPMGQRGRHTFANVREDHSISATFTFPLTAQAGYGGTITPNGTTLTTFGSDVTYHIAPISGFSISKVEVDGVNVGAVSNYTFSNVTASHLITATFTGTGGGGSVPKTNDIIFSALTDTLPASGTISSWSTQVPSGQSLTAIASPTVETIDSRKFSRNDSVEGDGYRFGNSYSSSIPCTGASVVVVAKPTRFGSADSNWQSIVDVFYDRLALGIMNGSGKICVRHNGGLDYSDIVIPDGQMTILSLVVQPNGSYTVYANGVEAMSKSGNGEWTALVPGANGFQKFINVGRNNPDGWTTYNGDIGDVFLYKTALDNSERVELETYLINRLTNSGPTFSISASAGAGGMISPTGTVNVIENADQTFTISPDSGFTISDVIVDGSSVGAVASYTFSNVAEGHTIAVNFASTGNTPPTCSTVPDQNIEPDSSTAVLAFTVGDSQTPVGDLVVTSASSNPTLVPDVNVVLGGSGENRTVQVTPTAGETGSSTITLTVSDGDLSTRTTFVVTVTAPPVGGGGAIGINFDVNGAGSAALSSTDIAGVVPSESWNNVQATAVGQAFNYGITYVDDSGVNTTLTVAASSGIGDTWNTGGTPDDLIFGDKHNMSNPGTLSLSNVPYATYDLYLYSAQFGFETVQFEIGGVTKTLVNTFAPQFNPSGDPDFVQNDTYVRYQGLSGDVVVNMTGDIALGGFQIVNTAISGGDNYVAWIGNYPAVGGMTGFDEDPDGDGVDNGIESYLGSDPGAFSRALTVTSSSGSEFTFSHSESNTIPSDMSADYEWSLDLIDWYADGADNGAGVTVTITEDSRIDNIAPDNDVVTATAIATGFPSCFFVRLRAVLQTL